MVEKTYSIATFGCQMNVHDSSWLERSLQAKGFTAAPAEEATVIILNTCSVRGKAEHKVYSLIGKIVKQTKNNPHNFVVVGGCVAQQVGRTLFSRFPKVRLVFGSDGIVQAPDAIERLFEEPSLRRISLLDFTEEFVERDEAFVTRSPIAYVNIMQGCNNFCAYCIVPYTRGRQKSREYATVINECKELISRGTRDITLLGQNVNAYAHDFDDAAQEKGFVELLEEVATMQGVERLRFVTSHPKDFPDKLVTCFAQYPNLAPRVHLPIQAGSDKILAAMGRKYTVEQYFNIIDTLKTARLDIVFTSDVIVGFPGETEEDFQHTLDVLKRIDCVHSYSFSYSDRPGTRASKMLDKIAPDVQSERLARLQGWQNMRTLQWMESFVDKPALVLLEDNPQEGVTVRHGREVYGNPVHVEVTQPDIPLGMFVPVLVKKAKKHSLAAIQTGNAW